ncbi:MAG: DUF167 domain-containing protein [Nitriliruptoraceae bacterium]
MATDNQIPADCVRPHDGGSTVAIRVVPRASRNAILGTHGRSLKVAVHAPPADGAANTALCRYLAEVCGVAAADVTIVMGARSREKVVHLARLQPGAVQASLGAQMRR